MFDEEWNEDRRIIYTRQNPNSQYQDSIFTANSKINYIKYNLRRAPDLLSPIIFSIFF